MTSSHLAVVSSRDDVPTPASQIPPLRPIPPRRQRARGGTATRTATGRYRNVNAHARLPANGLANSPSPNAQLALAVVPDPMERNAHLVVTVNRRVDLLEHEYHHGRISESAYRVGRQVQSTFERLLSMGSAWSVFDRVDATRTPDDVVESKVDQAGACTALMRRITKEVGMVGARRLRGHLVEGLTYPEAAAQRGQSGREAVTFAAKSFRQTLEDLADAWSATGPRR